MDALQEIRDRLARIEARLALLERGQAMPPSTPAVHAAPVARATPTPPASTASLSWQNSKTPAAAADNGAAASQWMAWGAAIAFLLAAVYLLRIVYDSGWLTPPRQVGLATLGGFAMIAGGLALARLDRLYAAYLPAVGTVVLYVAAYAAHLYYDLIPRDVAIAAVSVTGIVALWLGRHFNHSVFAVFATIGTYLFPLWLPAGGVAVGDLVVYFAAWSIAFAVAALIEPRRLIYVLSMFCSLISFQITWELSGNQADWLTVVLFQLFQFLLSVTTAVAYSLRHRQPMGSATAIVHGIALFYFYAFEYVLLHKYAPEWAGIVALTSAAVVLFAYLIAQHMLATTLSAAQRSAGAVLASSYCAVVTAHILFFEWLPGDWIPWGALLAPLLVLLARPLFHDTPQALWPIRLVSGAVFAIGFLSAMINEESRQLPLPDLVLFVYALVLYAGYFLARRPDAPEDATTALLYAGHISAMLAVARAVDSDFAISMIWGLLALALLAIALARRDRALGRSSLLVFAISAVKVLVFDLHGTDSLWRVFTLLVVGGSLYAGGWLYQRMFREPETSTEISPPTRT